MDTILLAAIADRLGHIIWMFSEDGQKGRNHPDSLVEALSGDGPKKADGGLQTFATSEDFTARWKAITQQ